MEIYRAKLKVLDYLFYATTEIGKVYETGAFIHNYALCYALKLVNAPYSRQIQKPTHEKDLKPLNDLGIYITPAYPLQISYRLIQWNTIQERYGFPKKEQNIGYPDWGFARVITPESSFEFYILIADVEAIKKFPQLEQLIIGKTGYIRLGKFLAKSSLVLTKAQEITAKKGSFFAGISDDKGRLSREKSQSSLLLNWRDIPIDPFVCDIYPATLPTRLIANSKYENSDYYHIKFGEKDEIKLPINMSFVARPLTTNKKKTTKKKKND
jgi:CRISPR-associated protein Csc1